VALDLPPDYFDAAFAESQFSFRLSHYPPVPAEPNQFGIAPHTDANFLTFLAQTDVPGLQLRLPSGDWLDVPYVPDSYAVNGDMLARWTNGRFKSTPHRALPPVGSPLRHPFFLPAHRHGHRVPTDMPGPGQSSEASPDHLRRLSALVVRRELQRGPAGRQGVSACPAKGPWESSRERMKRVTTRRADPVSPAFGTVAGRPPTDRSGGRRPAHPSIDRAGCDATWAPLKAAPPSAALREVEAADSGSTPIHVADKRSLRCTLVVVKRTGDIGGSSADCNVLV
jgi:hypothetical protein